MVMVPASPSTALGPARAELPGARAVLVVRDGPRTRKTPQCPSLVPDVEGQRRWSSGICWAPTACSRVGCGSRSGGFPKSIARSGELEHPHHGVCTPGRHAGWQGRRPAHANGGLLYLCHGNGSRGWLRPRFAARGWDVFFTTTNPGGFNGHGKSGFLVRGRVGTLWTHPGDGTAAYGRARCGRSSVLFLLEYRDEVQ